VDLVQRKGSVVKFAILVAPKFDGVWPYAADRLRQLLEPSFDVSFDRVAADVTAFPGSAAATCLIALGIEPTAADLAAYPALTDAFVSDGYRASEEVGALLADHGIRQLKQPSEGFWGQSVSEFGLALTLAALRRIPQLHHSILTSLDDWNYPQQQFGDDPRFTNGTVEGKRVRIVGAGNIASRYASFVHMLGADVAAWDPYASEPAFHRAGARKEWHLENLVKDAEIFVPMVPLMPGTAGLVTAEHIRALPDGCLVVMVTRAGILDMAELRRRVLADELSLAADVFDIEPVPLDDPLLGRHNVVHTPHNAGRTKESNFRWAEMLAEQFAGFDRNLVPAPTPLR
jgi:phosphoglycerate dehydrogenase-like enzyme